MGPITLSILIAWVVMKGYEATREEYQHTRGQHAKDLAKQHPDWSPRRVKRAAGRRARAHWWTEIRDGFPAWKEAREEDWLTARTAAAEARAAGHARRKELWGRLDAARAQREQEKAERQAAKNGRGTTEPPAVAPVPPDGTIPDGTTPDGTGAPVPSVPPPVEPVPPIPEGEPEPSAWLNPGDRRCEGCDGSGRNRDGSDACPACRGFGSAPPDPMSPVASPGTVCAACGHAERPGDPVLNDPSGPVHLSHAAGRQVAYWDALNRVRNEPTPAAPGGMHPKGADDEAARPAMRETLDGHLVPADGPREPGTPAGERDARDDATPADEVTDTEGSDEVTTPTTDAAAVAENAETPYQGMQNALTVYEQHANAAADGVDDLNAAAAVHGFDRDTAFMAALQQVNDLATQLQTTLASARQGLVARHTEGEEYHGTGTDAHASAFRPA